MSTRLRSTASRTELLQLLDVLEDRAEHQTFPIAEAVRDAAFADVPLALHARYTRDEVLALGRSTVAKPFSHREGPFWHPETNTDYFFITLEKSEKYYSPTTRYRDYAIAPALFHWESQSTIRPAPRRPALHPPHRTRQPRHAPRPPVEQGRLGPHPLLHLPRPRHLHQPHRRTPDGRRLAPASGHADGVFKVARVAAG